MHNSIYLLFFIGLISCRTNIFELKKYPEITEFESQKSDQFLVNIDDISDGHPFKGLSALSPHQGGHIHFDNTDTSYHDGMSPNEYPPIYAVADGKILRIDKYFKVYNPNDGDHYKYDIELLIARDGNKSVSFSYSIEPMIDPENESFYEPYILVEKGQKVKKGEVIAYMYLSPGYGIGSHIHFQINKNNKHMSPSIFNDDIIQSFHDKWDVFGQDSDGSTSNDLPPCIGYKISEEENPFDTGYKETL